MVGMESKGRWGTWEELVLGSAFLRHGAAGGWAPIAREVALRSAFSPSTEECAAKFGEVQARYSGSNSWFEELLKERVAELKREIEKSDNSIGSLLSKIGSLSNCQSKEGNCDYDISCTDSPSITEKSANIDTSCKELLNQRSAVQSFRADANPTCSSSSKDLASVKTQSIPTPVAKSVNFEEKKVKFVDFKSCFWGVRKIRGKRKRSTPTVKESTKGSEALSCEKEESYSGSGMQILRPSSDEPGSSVGQDSVAYLTRMLKCIGKGADFTMLQRQLAKQRRKVKYKVIRQHIDIRLISSKIRSGLISSKEELLRDLLLLVNNIVAIFPKGTLEYMSAVSLREHASAVLQESLQHPVKTPVSSETSTLCRANKAQNSRACNGRSKRKNVPVGDAENLDAAMNNKNSRAAASAWSSTKSIGGTPVKRRRVMSAPTASQKRQRTQQESSKRARKKF